MKEIHVPVGTSDFAEIRREGYYFVDKSGLIEELLKARGVKATLITRPRRFGKTLAMSMLSEFFDIRKNSQKLFEGLSAAENKELCQTWMNQYPTLFLSFRSVAGLKFSDAYAMLAAVTSDLYKEHLYLMDSDKLSALDKEAFYQIASQKAAQSDIGSGLLVLTRMLDAHYGKPVILLLDEYDVPLAKASENGYYQEMMDVIKNVMLVIKDNPCLKLAVITGCLRIAKESIFTGANNLVSDTIFDTRFNEYFGFTQSEVEKLLQESDLYSHKEEIKNWYDGYRFGGSDIYCPWDVMNHVKDLLFDNTSAPKNFWENTSDNSIIRSFLKRTDFDVTEKFETLLSGGSVREPISENLTYDILESSEENLWSLLCFTGYLTRLRPGRISEAGLLPGQYDLTVPNAEVMEIFKKSVKTWFTERSVKSDRSGLFGALWNGDSEKLTVLISDLLFNTISYHDYRESFYHAFITGLVSNAGFEVQSNYENGLGRSDLVIKDRRNRRAVVIEAKWTDSEDRLETECEKALQQIEAMQYGKKVEKEGFRKVRRAGMAFCRKECLVKFE